jgi:hypothetical protein
MIISHTARCLRAIQYPDVRVPSIAKELDLLASAMPDYCEVLGFAVTIPPCQEKAIIDSSKVIHAVKMRLATNASAYDPAVILCCSGGMMTAFDRSLAEIPVLDADDTMNTFGPNSIRAPILKSGSKSQAVASDTSQKLMVPVRANVRWSEAELLPSDISATLQRTVDMWTAAGVIVHSNHVYVVAANEHPHSEPLRCEVTVAPDSGFLRQYSYKIQLTSWSPAVLKQRISKFSKMQPQFVDAHYDFEDCFLLEGWHVLWPLDPVVRRELQLRLSVPVIPFSIIDTQRLTNVHEIATPPPFPFVAQPALVQGSYLYYHYLVDGVNDRGWGCAYRSLQTIFSWYLLQGFMDKKVPSIAEIQKTLVDVKDKKPSFVGSRDWIGAFELSIVLNQTLNVDSRLIYCSHAGAILDHVQELRDHFLMVGTPVMIGGGNLAYTCVGVYVDPQNPHKPLFCIADPHYVGDDTHGALTGKKWVAWHNIDLFAPTSFYNICMPQLPVSK